MAPTGIPYRLVDVFATRALQGNPAAVVLQGAGLSDQQMARIAAEMNVSATAFVLAPKAAGPDTAHADARLRCFTPTCEVATCTHATIAAVHALAEVGRLPAGNPTSQPAVSIDTQAGVVQAHLEPPNRSSAQASDPLLGPRSSIEDAWSPQPVPAAATVPTIWLDLASPRLRPEPMAPDIWARLLRTSADVFVADPPPVRTQDDDLIVFVNSILALNGLQPAFDELAAWSQQRRLRGLCVATTSTLAPTITVQSRFFAPAVGVNEDPVTGSVHGPLAAHLLACGRVKTFDNCAALACVQSTPAGRAGLVRVLVERQSANHYEVRIGAQCVTVASGVIYTDRPGF